MCNNPEIASREAAIALDNVMEKITLEAKGRPVADIRQDMWMPVPREAIECGYMKLMGLGEDGSGWSYSITKLYPDSKSIFHHHHNLVEKFILIKGKFTVKVYEDADMIKIIREASLIEIGEIEIVEPGEWHFVLSSQEETYIIVVYKKNGK